MMAGSPASPSAFDGVFRGACGCVWSGLGGGGHNLIEDGRERGGESEQPGVNEDKDCGDGLGHGG